MNQDTDSSQKMTQAITDIQQKVGPQIEQVKQNLTEFDVKARKAMRENPAAALMVAVGAGFLIGRLVSRR